MDFMNCTTRLNGSVNAQMVGLSDALRHVASEYFSYTECIRGGSSQNCSAEPRVVESARTCRLGEVPKSRYQIS